MHQRGRSMANGSRASDYSSMMLILIIIMFLAPMGIVFYFFDESGSWYAAVLAMLWYSNMGSFGTYYSPYAAILATLPLSFMKMVYVFLIWRAYQGKATTRQAIRFGIAMELWFPFLYSLPYLISLLFVPMFFEGWLLAIPLPILLLSGWLALKLHPPVGTSASWVATEQREDWWHEPSTQDSGHESN